MLILKQNYKHYEGKLNYLINFFNTYKTVSINILLNKIMNIYLHIIKVDI